jgi:Zn-dependent metalloprotease
MIIDIIQNMGCFYHFRKTIENHFKTTYTDYCLLILVEKKGLLSMHRHSSVNCFLPPHVLKNIATKGTESQKNLAIMTLKTSARMRGQRQALADFSAAAFRVTGGGKDRIVYDARNGSSLPGTIVRRENDPATEDVAVNEAFDGSGITYDLFTNV